MFLPEVKLLERNVHRVSVSDCVFGPLPWDVAGSLQDKLQALSGKQGLFIVLSLNLTRSSFWRHNFASSHGRSDPILQAFGFWLPNFHSVFERTNLLAVTLGATKTSFDKSATLNPSSVP